MEGDDPYLRRTKKTSCILESVLPPISESYIESETLESHELWPIQNENRFRYTI
jgi:hypothetical protein